MRKKTVSRTRYQNLRASLTVESAFVLPIFVMFTVVILFFFKALSTQLIVEEALDYAARISAATTTSKDTTSLARGVVLSYFKLGGYELPEKCILGGSAGIIITEADDSEQELLTATYVLRAPIKFFGFQGITVSQKVQSRKWIGYTNVSVPVLSEEYVYVTEYGTVYHRTTACTHLDLSIQAVSGYSGVLNQEKNYRACEYCKPSKGESVYYVTNYGDAYHNNISCSGLKRTIYKKPISEVAGMRACSKCGGKG